MNFLGRKWVRLVLAGVALIFTGLAIWIGPVLVSAKKAGLLDSTEAEKYQPSREANLKAIATALNLVHDSDGVYPPAENWMDTIGNRLQRNGMTNADAQLKLVRPGLDPAKKQFGYAYNKGLAGKYRGDVADKQALLVVESRTLTRNYASDGRLEPGLWGITLDGTIVKTAKPN